MPKKVILVAVSILSFTSVLNAGIVTVKQDGTGDYTTIEEGMGEIGWNSGDTVLVWPGVYYENLYYYGNHITVASLYAIDPDPTYIQNTIIDGGQFAGSCVNMKYGDDDLIVNGFTIRNGAGVYGGGIYIYNATGIVRNCIIESNAASKYGGGICIDDGTGEVSDCVITNNISSQGGGIHTTHSSLTISGTTVKLNHARGMGGGINCGYESQIHFDPDNKCNLYLNYGAPGTDYYKYYDVPPQFVILDTCTVVNPGTFFFAAYDSHGYPVNEVTVQWDHAYLEQIEHDLYVNPVSGDDGNSGISINDPLKTIAFASILTKSDSLNPHKIHLSNGLYSPSESNEKLPFCIKNYISLVGESLDSTIIDADSLSFFMRSLGYNTNFSMENITFQQGTGGIHIRNNDLVSIDNVTLKNVYNDEGFAIYNVDSLIVKNTIVKNVRGGFAFSIGCWYGNNTSFLIENCVIMHNGPGVNTTFSAYRGGGIEIIGQEQSYPSELGHGILSNVQITDNIRRYEPELESDRQIALEIRGYYKIDLINSTIANNILTGLNGGFVQGFGTSVASSGELNIYNSCLYGNSAWELLLGYVFSYGDPSTCRVYYSDIEGGQQGVYNYNQTCTLVWGPGNIDSAPLWDTTAATPYVLPWNSPCVNTGTPKYEIGIQPPYIIQEDTAYKLVTFNYDTILLPSTDLAGNPRIIGDRIDMGAFECQDTTTSINKFEIRSLKFEVYPNPFCSNTIISFELRENAEVKVIIYDLYGNEIKRLEHASLRSGKYKLIWDGNDMNGHKLSNGIYMIALIVNGRFMASEKIVKKGK